MQAVECKDRPLTKRFRAGSFPVVRPDSYMRSFADRRQTGILLAIRCSEGNGSARECQTCPRVLLDAPPRAGTAGYRLKNARGGFVLTK